MMRLKLLLLSLICVHVRAKKVSGDFKLDGVHTEHVLTKFAVVPAGGRVTTTFTTKKPYPNDQHVKFRLYKDDDWPKFERATTCREKVLLAQQTNDLDFERQDEGRFEAKVLILMFNDKHGDSKRPHYWYFVVDDCTLEEYYQDSSVPLLHYELESYNHFADSRELSHLSADEQKLTVLHTATLVVSGLVAALLLMRVAMKAVTAKSTIHAALLWVSVVASLDCASSMFALVHLQVYKSNGVGSYFCDALSAHCEAICDALIILLLLSIAAGWTLPSDVIAVNPNATSVQRLLQDLSKPLTSMRAGNLAGILALTTIGAHVVLAQWGRTYNDDFESYHDFEHLPGKILMVSRICLGVLLLAATMQTRLRCPSKLQSFYFKLAVLGFGWCQSLPLLTFYCNRFVPYYLRNPSVYIGSATMQTTSILLLAWLVTSHATAYHRLSHMSSANDSSLTEELNSLAVEEPRTLTMGKAKLRLD